MSTAVRQFCHHLAFDCLCWIFKKGIEFIQYKLERWCGAYGMKFRGRNGVGEEWVGGGDISFIMIIKTLLPLIIIPPLLMCNYFNSFLKKNTFILKIVKDKKIHLNIEISEEWTWLFPALFYRQPWNRHRSTLRFSIVFDWIILGPNYGMPIDVI